MAAAHRLRLEHEDIVELTPDAIDIAALLEHVKDASAGAVCSFLGTTRDSFDGRTVTRLEYEAYVPLAVKTMAAIVAEARQHALDGYFSAPSASLGIGLPPLASTAKPASAALTRIALSHRLGEVPPKEASILIAVSSPHRREAFAACEWILEATKRRVEIWKRERYADSGAEFTGRDGASWKQNFEPEERPDP